MKDKKRAPKPRLKKKYSIEVSVSANKSAFGKVTSYTAKLHNFEYTAADPDTAVAQLAQALEQVSAAGAPAVVFWRGVCHIAVYSPHFGWTVVRAMVPQDAEKFDVVTLVGGSSLDTLSSRQTYSAILEALQYRAYQYSRDPADGYAVPYALPPERIDDVRRDLEFQQRYRDAIRNGLGAGAAHDYAGRNPAKPELWAHEGPRAPAQLLLPGCHNADHTGLQLSGDGRGADTADRQDSNVS